MRKIKLAAIGALLLMGLLLGACTKYNIIETGIADGRHDTTMLAYLKTHKAGRYELLLELIERAGMQKTFEQTGAGDQITFFAPTDYSIRRYLYEFIGKLRDQRDNLSSELSMISLDRDDLKTQLEAAETDEDRARLAEEIKAKEDELATMTTRVETAERELAKYAQYRDTDFGIKDMSVEQCQQYLKALIIPGKRLMVANIKSGKKIIDREGIEGGEKFATMGTGELWLYTFKEAYANVPSAGPIVLHLRAAADPSAVIFVVESSDIQTLSGIVHTLPSQRYTLGDIQ